ncbi:MAG: hypothetical protein Q7S27_04835 [Nanoarchaeota archaeon]|nr:hypothetical protein [Nanoarchaeota archaeon]
MRLNDAFRKRENAKKTLEQCEKVIYEHARPLILSVLEIVQDRYDFPGKTPEEVTAKIKLLYNNRYTTNDIRSVMLLMRENNELEHSPKKDGYVIRSSVKNVKIVPFRDY